MRVLTESLQALQTHMKLLLPNIVDIKFGSG